MTWYGDDHFRSVISNDKNWSSAVRTKASEAGITFEEQLTKDAEWVFEKEYPEIFKLNKLIANYKTQITKDSLWFAAVSEKSTEIFHAGGRDAKFRCRVYCKAGGIQKF